VALEVGYAGMALPAAFETLITATPMGDNMTMTMDYNMISMGYITCGGNSTSIAETESLPSAGETGSSVTNV
jgi:hypothetical protein